ncbi:hypothetical protein [Nocardia sp. NPDC052112]|uniref:hypothetical protein n=1 Tax=Nocardia sp. NPDC052112 TaxID=3155646 RepID=UPI00344647A2
MKDQIGTRVELRLGDPTDSEMGRRTAVLVGRPGRGLLLIDDYDMIPAGINPLRPLLEYLPQARDIGLHVVVTRRTGGVSSALYDNVLGGMKNLSVDALIMSGPKDEGKLIGDVRPMKLPRGIPVSRNRGQELVQVAYLPPL